MAARAAERPAFPLTAFAAELCDERNRLNVLSAGDDTTEVRAVLSWSYRTLSPAAARLFRLLSLTADADTATATAASLAGVGVQTAQGLLTELTAAGLAADSMQATLLTHLGETHAAADDEERAQERWQAALMLLDQLDSADTAALKEWINRLRSSNPVA